MKNCPKCNRECYRGAKVCHDCGFNFHSPDNTIVGREGADNAVSQELWYVYKGYNKGDCSDHPPTWYFESEKDAKKAVEQMKQLQKEGKDNWWAYNPSGWRAYWAYAKLEPESVTYEEFEADLQIRKEQQ